jgi:cellulose 1,4-beta-cellobiosidase
MTSSHTSVTNLDLGPLAADSVARGYMTGNWWLIGVEYGFEPWQGGQGLKLNSGNVCTPAGC